jgi:hypothetical protein
MSDSLAFWHLYTRMHTHPSTMYVRIGYLCIYICMSECMKVCIYVCLDIHMYVSMYVCMYVFMFSMYTYTNTCTCTYRCAVWTWTCTMDMEIDKQHGCQQNAGIPMESSIREQWWLIASDTRLWNCSPGFESNNFPSLQWTASPWMGCHLGWHFSVGFPLRGGRGEFN